MHLLSMLLVALLGSLAVPFAASADGRMCMVVPQGEQLHERNDLMEAVRPSGSTDPREELVLWCAGSDDARCSPVRHDERPGSDLSRSPLRSAHPGQGSIPASAETDGAPFLDGSTGPSQGIRHRVERPPRT
jgi:hypothetical protein